MTTITSATKNREQALLSSHIGSALLAALLGLVILYGVGFAPLAAHNAAHDARHSAAFPCH
jgi:cobalt transporter subunit CbtB